MDPKKVTSEMDQAMSDLKQDISQVRTGRASSSMVENIVVSAYGGAQRLKIMELANINAQDPTLMVIEPWDKQVVGEIRKAILAANVGLNPSIDGDVIRISIPPMTGEDREKFVKLLHTKLENAKVHIRQIRADAMKDIKTAFEAKDIGEDEKFSQEESLQRITDEYTQKVEELGKIKESELLQV